MENETINEEEKKKKSDIFFQNDIHPTTKMMMMMFAFGSWLPVLCVPNRQNTHTYNHTNHNFG